MAEFAQLSSVGTAPLVAPDQPLDAATGPPSAAAAAAAAEPTDAQASADADESVASVASVVVHELGRTRDASALADFLREALAGDGGGAFPEAAYYEALLTFTEENGPELSAYWTAYTMDGVEVELFDVKCKKRFEDPIIERLVKAWDSKYPDSVCPFRRGKRESMEEGRGGERGERGGEERGGWGIHFYEERWKEKKDQM